VGDWENAEVEVGGAYLWESEGRKGRENEKAMMAGGDSWHHSYL